VDATTLCRLETAAPISSQNGHHSYICPWSPVEWLCLASICITLTCFSNIVIGGLRISAITEVTYGSDVTYGIGTTLLWSMAQISIGIIVACCPYLRPVFELVMPKRLIGASTPVSSPYQPRRASIIVTTRIDIHDTLSTPLAPTGLYPPVSVAFHDDHVDPWAPIFRVEGPVCDESGSTAHGNGCLKRCSCRS
jgi:hypothetical protein